MAKFIITNGSGFEVELTSPTDVALGILAGTLTGCWIETPHGRVQIIGEGATRNPGRFEGEPATTEILWMMAQDGGTDDDADSERGDGASLLRTRHPRELFYAWLDMAEAYVHDGEGIPVLSPDEARDLLEAKGGILWSNTDRFVHGHLFYSSTELDDAWEDTLADFSDIDG